MEQKLPYTGNNVNTFEGSIEEPQILRAMLTILMSIGLKGGANIKQVDRVFENHLKRF